MSKIFKAILRYNNKAGSIILPDFKVCNKVKDHGISLKETLNASVIGNLGTDSHFCSQLVFYNSSKNIH